MPFISKGKWRQLEALLRDMKDRLDRIEGRSSSLASDREKGKGEARYDIKIETLNVQEVRLDELTFRMDQISIDDLSGSFNLGNNFLHRAKSGEAKSGESASASGSSASGPAPTGDVKEERTPKGYRVLLNPTASEKNGRS